MKNLTKRQRNRIYKKGKQILIASYNVYEEDNHDCLCECLRQAIYDYKLAVPGSFYYEHVREILPEFAKRKPKSITNMFGESYWYTFDNRGFTLRQRLLDNCIEETK